MKRKITVKGIGKVSVRPDTVELSMELESRSQQYEEAMQIAADQLLALEQTLVGAGFEADAIKTTNFQVQTEYKNVPDEKGLYHQEFDAYVVSHQLKLTFELQMERLSQALAAIAQGHAHPHLNIHFVAKDAEAVNEALLRSAAANARQKAEILCAESGVQLGRLRSIDYSWEELSLCSPTRYRVLADVSSSKSINMQPEDIKVSDTATFVWEIV